MADNKQETKTEQEVKGVATTKEQFQAFLDSLKQLETKFKDVDAAAEHCKDTAAFGRFFSDDAVLEAVSIMKQSIMVGEFELADWDKLQTKTRVERATHLRSRALLELLEGLAKGLRERTETPKAESTEPQTEREEDEEEEECCGCCEDE
jgi:hypothetical protein